MNIGKIIHHNTKASKVSIDPYYQVDENPVRQVDRTIRSVEPGPAYTAWVGWLDRLARKDESIPVEIPEKVRR